MCVYVWAGAVGVCVSVYICVFVTVGVMVRLCVCVCVCLRESLYSVCAFYLSLQEGYAWCTQTLKTTYYHICRGAGGCQHKHH